MKGTRQASCSNSGANATEMQEANAPGAFATVPRMKKKLPKAEIEARQAYVQLVVDTCFGKNKSALGRRLGNRDGSFIGQMLRDGRTVSETTIRAIAELPEVKNAGIPAPNLGVLAHPMSVAPFEDRLLTKEQIMEMAELPERFVYVLEDDALAPDYRAGTKVLFQRCEDASLLKVGAGMLLRATDGELHIRRKAQGGAPDQWVGRASNELYRDIHSEAAQVIGWWRGVLDKGLED